jgi:hypothetical protein
MLSSTASRLTTLLLIVCLAIEFSCAYANAHDAVPRIASATHDEKKDDKEAQKLDARNNAASLLADLLGDEKNVGKLLIVKHSSPATKQLIEAISKTADDGGKQLNLLAKSDNALKLDATQLPPGEKDARDDESKTKEHQLLFSSGVTFEFNLLLTQAQALSYGSHLAKVAADNSSAPEAQREFHSLETSLNSLYERVVARMRALPQSKT